MKLEKIYKKASTGKIVEWEVEIQGNKFRTITGQQGGKKVTSKWKECAGKNVGKKNETTPEEQALKEAQAARTKKLEKDYKENVAEIEDLEYFKPMLAYEYEKDRQYYPCYSQPKLDGIRAVATKDWIKSRNGKLFYSIPHIEVELRKIFEKYPNVVIDGELYNHKYKDDFNAITSIVRRTKLSENDLKKSRDYIQYWVYDIYLPDQSDKNFGYRFEGLRLIIDRLDVRDPIVLVPTAPINDKKQLDTMYENYIDAGYEGQIIRLNKPYENKRTKSLLKRKEFIMDEFIIKNIVEGEGNRSGTAGYIETITKSGKAFRSNLKGSFKYLEKVLKNKENLIGKTATIRYFRLTPDGIPRFPYVIAIDRKDYE